MASLEQQADVVVVGGGLAGLTAAIFAARAGRSVALFESGEIGGRATTLEVQGYRLNQGPHALYNAGAAARLLRELDVAYTGGLSPSRRYLWHAGELHSLPADPAALLTSRLFGVVEKAEVESALAALHGASLETLRDVTVREWLDQTAKSQRVRWFLEALVRLSTFGPEPERQSAGAALAQVRLGAEAGVTYVDGGWQSLTDGLRAVARDAGVRVFSGVRVERILGDETARGVRLAGGEVVWDAQSVVAAVSPRSAAMLTSDMPTPSLRRWAEDAVPIRLASLDLALSCLPRPELPFALGLEAPLYFAVHSGSARLAPEGGAVLHVARYLGSEPPADPGAVEQELEAWLDELQPGWRGAVVARRYLPNRIVSHGMRRADRRGLLPGPDVPGVSGLWVAGDWVGDVGMLADMAVSSGRLAGELAAESAGVERRRVGV